VLIVGLKSLHKSITKTVLKGLKFSDEAIQLAADSNEQVDEKQSDNAKETNLHAMRGHLVSTNPRSLVEVAVRMQSEEEARTEVKNILAKARTDFVAFMVGNDLKSALRCLGAALHTVQDEKFHQYEMWPYAGIGDAIKNDPNYMFMHGVRDTGMVSKLEARTRLDGMSRLAIELTRPLGSGANNWFLSLEGFTDGQVTARAAKLPGAIDLDRDWYGTGGMAKLTWGGAPGSVPGPNPIARAGQIGAESRPASCSELTRGPEAAASATEASRQFVESLAQVVRPEGWSSLRNWQPGRAVHL
jgi:hypothetical protein